MDIEYTCIHSATYCTIEHITYQFNMASPDLTVLHRLIWFDDHEGLQAYLQDLESSSEGVQEEIKRIDAKFRGMAPIHLAIQLGHEKCVKILCEHGADMLIATDLGFLPLQEATSIGDRDMMREILIKRHEQMRNYVYRRQSHLHKVISEDIEDFYLEMNWDFKSWGKSTMVILFALIHSFYNY